MMDIHVDAMGIPSPEGHPNSTRGAEREKKIPYIRSETEKSKKSEICPKRRGPRWDLNPHVGMSKGLDLVIKEQEGTSHQAALVIGGINVINTGIGHGQCAPKHPKGMSAQRGE
jgi:hypothetical protein